MLLNFRVKNYLSIKEEVLFTMEATKYKSDNLINNNLSIGQVDLLKSAVIFGPNGSGKSNIILAMKKMRYIVENMLSKKNRITPFKFDVISANEPTNFEVKFLYEDVIYRYGFSVKNEIIVEEWLYYKNNKSRARENQYFQRNFQDFQNFGEYKKEADLIKKENKTREDKLYITIVAEFNGKISRDVIQWFETFNIFSGIHSDLTSFTLEKMENELQKERIIDFLQSADFGIVDLKEKKISFDDVKINIEDENLPIDILDEMKEKGFRSIETFHHKYENKKFVGLEPLALIRESDGTQKLFELVGAIIECLDNGEILIIDELDNSFHTKMTEAIIKLFNSEKNIKNAQLIFASHDTNILTQKLFRRDQIWFTEKNIYGETQLYSLIDFGTRKDASLEKNYLEGNYGSIPAITELEYEHG